MKRIIATTALLLLAMAPARSADLIEQVESYYNSIFVYQRDTYITLAFGHEGRTYTESMRNTADLLELPIPYTQSFTAAVAYPEELERFVMIGTGGGSTSWYLHKHMPDASFTAVELDPDMVLLAEKYYGLVSEPNLDIVESDGRLFLLRDENAYDVIFVDAYRGPFVPFHLLTREFYEIAKARLKPGGYLAQNVEPSTMLFDAAYATLLSVFDTVDFYPAGGNVIAVAYDGPRLSRGELISRAQERQERFGFRYDLNALVAERRTQDAPGEDIDVLTDDFAPVNILRAIEVHNRKWD